jgi:hypothetical protein
MQVKLFSFMKSLVIYVTFAAVSAIAVTGCGGGGSAVADFPAGQSGLRIGPSPSQTAPSGRSYPRTIAQKHVLTADYLGGYGGTYAFPWSVEAPYVNWAKASNPTDSDEQREVGIKTYVYTDPNDTYPGGPLYTSDESTFAHTCAGSRIYARHYGLNHYLMDPHSSNLLQLWRDSLPDHAHYDVIFQDDTNTLYEMNGTPCNYAPAEWLQAHVNETEGLGYPAIYNGAAQTNTIGMNQATNVQGGMAEQCYATPNSAGRITDSFWQTMENVEIQMAQQRKLFFCLSDSRTDAASSIDARTYDLASFLLTYDPTTSILMEFFGTSSSFHVEPETQLVALYPVVPTPSNVSSLKTASGAYGREYNACYLAGAFVGRCAVAINPSSFNTYSFPFAGRYTHSLVLMGGGVLDGGSVATNGPPPPGQLTPRHSVVALR